MTLTTQNYVRGTKTTNALERDVVEWFDEDLEPGNQTAKHRANLAWAYAFTIDCVVDQVNQHLLLQTVKLPIESANVNATAKYRGRRVDIITDLQTADRLAVAGRNRMYPARLISKHETPFN